MTTAVKKSDTNVKETIESILVAFILAFIFRCFVVEAFVIPTGSMAPTLMGAHMDFRCPDCGYRFEAGYSSNGSGESFSIPDNANAVFPIYCPNCGLHLPKVSANDPDNDATNPPLKFGDRILVMKYLNLFGDNPQRWDVIVFKSPQNGEHPGDFSINYIKRLIGRPGESLFVGHGDIYVAKPGSDKKDPASYVVQTKPQWVQDALWRIIFNADFVPQSKGNPGDTYGEWTQPWQQASGSGWINADPSKNISDRQFLFDNPTGTGELQFNAQANRNAAKFTDWLAYDQTGSQSTDDRYNSGPYDDVKPVADLKTSFFLSDMKGDGNLRIVLSKNFPDATRSVSFTAELSTNKVRLIMHAGDQSKVVGEHTIDLTGRHQVSLENVDYRVVLRIDGKDILMTSSQDYHPNVQYIIDNPNDAPTGDARIVGDRVQAKIEHLQLWRDVHYRSERSSRILRAFADGDLNHVVTLKEQEYFAMGDNSLMSADGRMWDQRVELKDEGDLKVEPGIVPERFLLGKAFFVYWPPGYSPFGLPIRAIPNFGDMRFIR